MTSIFTVDSLISLITLSLLEIVLGIDNVIFVSILMGRIEKEKKLLSKRIWMILGITIRVILLLAIGWLVANGNKELFGIDLNNTHYGFNLRNIILFTGGLFLLYKTVKEIHAKLEGDDHLELNSSGKKASFTSLMVQILFIDMIFSFDSIITAVGMAKHVEIMIIAVLIAMIIMFFFSEKISTFIHKHPTLKMLALSFLLMVGFSLFFEGLQPFHHSHIEKGYIYFAMAFSFGVELLNMRIRKKNIPFKPVELFQPKLEETDEKN